jgi:hypothetical protein
VVLAKHLTQVDVEAILSIIYAWKDEKITWEGICDASAPVIGKNPTRQSLNANKLIKEAYTSKKSTLKVQGPVTSKPSSITMATDRIARMQSEIESLKRKNSALLEQFVIWQYNAYKYGMKEHQLNEPLPRIDRERTET